MVFPHNSSKHNVDDLIEFPRENPNPVFRISKDGFVLYYNKPSLPLLHVMGFQENTSLPGKWLSLVQDVICHERKIERDLKCGDEIYSLTFAPVKGETYLNVYGLDVTVREKALQEIRELKIQLQRENSYLQEEIKGAHNFEEIVSCNKGFQSVLGKVQQVASTDATVLILGETGVGKELIARAIHSNSKRKNRPLVKVNCSALPKDLIESEFFGHEKGSFTGAIQQKIGRFELANGGTILLDEIGDLPFELQAKLLRVLQEGEFERVGSSHTRAVDVRVIAATHHDLKEEARNATFREDLFYRLNVFPIEVPPLRERADDIPLLVSHFLRKFSAKMGKRIETVPIETIEQMQHYSWPGNIRELENVIERGVIVSQNGVLAIDGISVAGNPGNANPSVQNATSLKTLEKELILKTLQGTNWVIQGERGAAKKLEIPPSTLRDRMRKYGITNS